MKDEIIITKMLTYVEKILDYVAGMKYEEFAGNDIIY